MKKSKREWRMMAAEAAGTAILLYFGLSIVIIIWGLGSSMEHHFPSAALRRAITGFLFGTVGCLITISPVGRISGAHINPAVSFAFWLRGKMHTATMIRYLLGQMGGALLGALPLLLWGSRGRSIQYSITLPGDAGVGAAFAGEMLATACLIIYLYIFIGTRRLRRFTPFGIPILYCILVTLVAPLSGCSTNPARSFGPAVITGKFAFFWLYCIAPAAGVVIVTAFFRWLHLHRIYKMEAARVSYHNSATPESLRSGFISP
jgi:aquaporin Z